ncbi:hypothetical protein GE061_003607 [Apolygus lucorum]|uniref:Uncharacterized protein n=1 Tax=Apolygus lucorum TaxID=248454 RepID=A0A8S9X3Z8_APOLU|nr:hypothetical protein GE061_003607 [Apolygus lucorum]
MSPTVVNVVVVGDSQCGKTSLLTSFYNGYHRDDIPTFDDYVTLSMDVDGEPVALELRDTVSSEACRRFRLFWYMGSHVVILVFAVDSPTSLNNVPLDWMPELRRICPDVPVILVGNKKDLREDLRVSSVTVEDGKSMSLTICAKYYIECSAVTGENVRRLFEIAAQAGMKNSKRTNKTKCVLL